MRKLNFIVNPVAKNGYSLKIWREIESLLHAQEIPYYARFTEYRGHARELAAEIADSLAGEEGIIAVVGGDGTLHETVNGVCGRDNIVIADIPAGSGNDFSRGLKLPFEPIAALKGVLNNLNSAPFLIDVGQVTVGGKDVHYFVNNFGAGFDAKVAMEVNRSSSKKFFNRLSMGTLAYAYVLIKELFAYKSKTVRLIIDGKEYEFDKTWLVNISNQPYIGGGMKLVPDASPDDGLLDVMVIHQLSKIKFLFFFVTVFWGGHKNFKEVKTFRGKHISVQSTEKMIIHADGEHIGETPAEIRILPRILKLVKETGSSRPAKPAEKHS